MPDDTAIFSLFTSGIRIDPDRRNQALRTMRLDSEHSPAFGIIMESGLTCLSKFINDSGKYEFLRTTSDFSVIL